MESIGVIVIAVVVVLLVVRVVFRACTDGFLPKPLLTRNEMEFYGRLHQALPEFAILPQVALRAFIKPKAAINSSAYWRQLGKIGSKHCDFLICNPNTLDIVAIIELDDRSHNRTRDAARDALTASAGYLTIRYESRTRPTTMMIRLDVLAHEKRQASRKSGD